MDADDTPRAKEYPLPKGRLSKTPSWIMLGFVLGALFVLALPPLRKKAAPPPETLRLEITQPRPPPAPKPLSEIEAVFAVWGKHATWSDDLTEVALWNSQERAFTHFYEVRRIDDVCYFRTIPALTRRLVTHGKPLPESPLQFTETEEQYREWLEHGRVERRVEQPARPPSAPAIPPVRAPAPAVTSAKNLPPIDLAQPTFPAEPASPKP